MRLKRTLIQESAPVKLDADPIFLHFAIASLVLAITGAVGSILREGFPRTAGDQFGSPNQTIIRNLQNDFSQGSNKIKK